MEKRRQFLKKTLGAITGMAVLFSPFFSLLRSALAQAGKIILPKGTRRENLIDKNPATLDARNLEITPLENFGTMGLSDHAENVARWRLEVTGLVKTQLRLKYDEILGMPALERKVLLICPGFFANYGNWKGVSIRRLLDLAEGNKDATHITLYGPEGTYQYTQRFPIRDVNSDTVFLAYQVNGKTLPQRHGFPLRTVAEGYYGHDWVKYVYKINVEKV
jgi:DMSO/TMAO reductase YedYZ molybdopterin-dependent catalytic subunit